MPNEVITFPATRREAKAGTNEVTTFTMPANLGGFAIRVIEIDGNPWFVAADLCRALNLDMDGGTHRHLQALAADERKIVSGLTGNLSEGSTGRGGLRASSRVTVISESGMYKLILRANRSNRAAAAFQDWVTREVLPAIRKDGMYVLGEEKVRTGELSEDEMTMLVLTRLQNKVQRITVERDQAIARADVAEQRNAVLEHLRGFVTVDAYLTEENHIDGRYKSKQERQIIGQRAAAICRARGIPPQKEHRTMRNKWGGIINTPVNIYPREVLAEACALLGYVRRPQILAS